jgi:hypothetical protein
VVRNAANESVVWLHTSAERFVSRKVRIVPVDGHTVAVTEGLSGGERVVVQGAASLSPDSLRGRRVRFHHHDQPQATPDRARRGVAVDHLWRP